MEEIIKLEKRIERLLRMKKTWSKQYFLPNDNIENKLQELIEKLKKMKEYYGF